jgi:hypothetical protein
MTKNKDLRRQPAVAGCECPQKMSLLAETPAGRRLHFATPLSGRASLGKWLIFSRRFLEFRRRFR